MFDKQFPLPDLLIADKMCCNFQPLNPVGFSFVSKREVRRPTLAGEGGLGVNTAISGAPIHS